MGRYQVVLEAKCKLISKVRILGLHLAIQKSGILAVTIRGRFSDLRILLQSETRSLKAFPSFQLFITIHGVLHTPNEWLGLANLVGICVHVCTLTFINALKQDILDQTPSTLYPLFILHFPLHR